MSQLSALLLSEIVMNLSDSFQFHLIFFNFNEQTDRDSDNDIKWQHDSCNLKINRVTSNKSDRVGPSHASEWPCRSINLVPLDL